MPATADTGTFRRTNFSGWLLTDRDRVLAELAAQGVTPAYERLVCEHVTYQYPDREAAPDLGTITIRGHAAADGVQALLVDAGGTIHRNDAGLYHVTLSLAAGRKPVESVQLLHQGPVVVLDAPITVAVRAF